MKILITGTPGWLGKKLVERLIKRGKQVRCLVYHGIDSSSLSKYRVEIVNADITNPISLKGICKGVSTVFHCAGLIHPKGLVPAIRARKFYDVNTYGTENILKEAVKSGVEKFIYVSSNCAGIGDHGFDLNREDVLPRPFMHYGLSKLEAEGILNDYFKRGDIKTVIIRPNWLYGLGGFGRQLDFIRMVKKGWPVFFGSGNNYHSLCDINNCLQALLLAESEPKAIGKTYYIADNTPYRILDLYNIIADLLGTKIKPIAIPVNLNNQLCYGLINRAMQGLRFNFPSFHIAWEWSKNLVCNIDKARESLGYSPEVDFRTGIRLAIEEYRSQGIKL